MNRPLYLLDPYMKEFQAAVTSANGKYIVLDNTAFYPNSGGQPHDTGVMTADGAEYKVVYAGKFGGNISHEVDREGLKAGDRVKCTIDWQRRYVLMRMHTSAHILSSVINKETGALITGNQLDVDQSRIDFSLEVLDREKIAEYIRMANEAIARHIGIKQYFLKREEAMKIPGAVKLAAALPPAVDELHMVEIGDVDLQADGGPHVANTEEVGQIELVKLENKGKNNRRIYYTLKE